MPDNRVVDEVNRSIPEAYDIIRRHIHRTPLELSATLSRIAGGKVYLKFENLQKTGSFKVRGALYKVSRVRDRSRGVITASAGNHAQGVAYASGIYNLKSVIVMPINASITKINATRGYGAEVVLYGEVYDDAERRAVELSRENGYTFIHPFNDPDVIAGQGTLALEIIQQVGDIDNVVIPIGGGGLISGIAIGLKSRRPNVRIIGVEPENAPKVTESLKAGKPVEVEVKPTIADGLAAKRPGDLTFSIIRDYVDEVIVLGEDEIAEAVYFLLERGKVVVEGAGAITVAAILSNRVDVDRGKTLLLLSGGNIDLTSIYRILMSGLARSGRIETLEMYVPDIPGTLAKISSIIARHRGNIIEVLHDRMDINVPAWHTRLKIVFESPSIEATRRIREELEKLRIIIL